MSIMVIILIIVGIFTFLNFQDIKRLKKENQELRLQNRIALESIEFLKRKINLDYKPIEHPLEQLKEEPKTTKEHQKAPAHTPPTWQYKPKKEKKNLENVLGKNIIGVIAAALIFIGIIAFGALIFNQITDGLKVALMVFGSALMLALGTFLSLKNKNAFTLSLSGCGAGALFITIFVTHIYFEMIGDILAFGLVLIWAIGMFLLSKKIDSKALVYVTHLGCIISSVLAIGYGQVENKMLEITIYQVLITALLLIEDYKQSQLLFKLSSWITMIINAVLVQYCYHATWYSTYQYLHDGPTIPAPIGGMTFAIAIILLLVNTASYLLSLKSEYKDEIIESIISHFIYFGTIIFGTMSTVIMFIERLLYPNEDIYYYIENDFHLWIIDTVPIIMVLFISVICLFVAHQILNNKNVLKYMNISHFAFMAFVLSARAIDGSNPVIPLICLISMACLYLYRKTQDNIYFISSLAFTCVDAFMILNLMDYNHPSEIFGIVYVLILLGVLVFAGHIKNNYFYFPALYFGLINSIGLIFALESFGEECWVMVIFTAINIVFSLIHQRFVEPPYTSAQKLSNVLIGIGESIYIFFVSLFIAFEDAEIELLILSILLLVYGLCKIKSLLSSENKLLGAWYGIKFTWLTLVPLNTFTSLMEEQFILSVSCMILAFLCILFGFGFNVKSTRIYGLVLIMASVLKIVVIDMWGQDSMIRVVSLIAGGIICFVISAIYNYFEKSRKVLPESNESDW